MKLGHIVKTIMVQKDMTARHASKMIGVSPQVLSNWLSRENITISSFIRMMDVLDYEVVVQPRKKGNYPQGSYPVTMGNDGGDQ